MLEVVPGVRELHNHNVVKKEKANSLVAMGPGPSELMKASLTKRFHHTAHREEEASTCGKVLQSISGTLVYGHWRRTNDTAHFLPF